MQPLIPDELTPRFLDHLKAKSADETGRQQTLAEHTWAVVSRLADQRRLRRSMTVFSYDCQEADVWRRLFCAAFLHDFGKAAREFQQRLVERHAGTEWVTAKHRHEVLSLAFADWLSPPEHEDRPAVLCTIVAHHKDFDDIVAKYGAGWRNKDQKRRVAFLAGQVDEADQQLLWRWANDFVLKWAEALGFTSLGDVTMQPFRPISANAIESALDECSDYLLRYEDIMPDLSALTPDLLHRGLILTADHAASAGTAEFPPMPLTREQAQRPLAGRSLRDHQAAALLAPQGSAILVGPTGSGKTEAAMLWAATQMEHRPAARLFYTLPYQASMNAMYERLAMRFFGHTEAELRQGVCQEVAVQHSRALLKHFQDYMALDESDARTARRVAKELQNLAQLNFYPIQVFSPYQMLKAAYSLKGYETLLLDYTDALFVFDEIHAYDAKRVALILTFMGWLRRSFGARFLVMTATLPPPLLEQLQATLDVPSEAIIRATPQEFERSRRHTVHIVEGCLQEQILNRVQADWRAGRSVLVCLNRVRDAQNVYRMLCDSLQLRTGISGEEMAASADDVDIVLLHSRFNGEDRGQKERILLARAGVGRRSEVTRPFICVATQVVEVSLDVDFDCLYTAPAPLEAMLQRFGRVNRGRSSSALCPVYVFSEPSLPGQPANYLPYEEAMVQTSLDVLRRYCNGKPIDESLVTTMLGEIYTGAIRAQWEQDFNSEAKEFQTSILDTIKPCQSAGPDLYQQFYKMFDGREVLPTTLYQPYLDLRDAEGYLSANRYLVNIAQRQYRKFKGYGLIKQASDQEGEYADHINAPYSREYGLDLEEARANAKAAKAGLTDSEESDYDTE